MSELTEYITEELTKRYRAMVMALPEDERWILTHCNMCGREKTPEEITPVGNPFCALGVGCNA